MVAVMLVSARPQRASDVLAWVLVSSFFPSLSFFQDASGFAWSTELEGTAERHWGSCG